jgi:hypothetical protein
MDIVLTTFMANITFREGKLMKSETCMVQQLFQDRRQYRVPFFQRAYVWEKESQWEPLWDDIVEKAEFRRGGELPSSHFLGAIVLEPQTRFGLRGVETLNIIDGQQRLTTLQYLLSALSIQLRVRNISSLLPLVDGCIWNSNTDTMEQPDIEIFKVWPTFRDRSAYQTAMRVQNTADLIQAFPESFTQAGTLRRIGIHHPSALGAIWFFHSAIDEWLSQMTNGEDAAVLDSLERLTLAVFRDLKVVSITLQEEDDAQVIFETLNARGAELHATDLIRNFIFMRADRENANTRQLYDTYWTPFEGPFWTEEQRRGRLVGPRLEWFVQTALQAKMPEEVEMVRLYAGYRRFAAPISAENQLQTLTAYADKYREFISGIGPHPVAEAGGRLMIWDVSPIHPIVLRVALEIQDADEQRQIYRDLASYVVRRAVCGLTAKNYNKVFLQIAKRIANQPLNRNAIASALVELEGNASRWPGDQEFRLAWMTAPVHSRLAGIGRVRAVLAELENGLRSPRGEEPFVANENLDIDHILPNNWYEHWPLDGETILESEASQATFAMFPEGDIPPRIRAIRRREQLKTTWGNLTLVHYGVNRSLQNGPFDEKREALFAVSNLHLNRMLMRASHWNEQDIEERGQLLFNVALNVWPSPIRIT